MRRPSRALALALAAGAAFAAAAGARVLLTVEEALALAFPGSAIERGTVYLTDAQRARAAALAGGERGGAIVHPYVARRDGVVVGTAYFDVHLVRTLAERVMVTVDAQGRLGRIEVLSFDEPPDYLPRSEWYRQFEGRPLDAELELRRAIRPVAGATLTARATTAAARRALALHQVLAEAAGRTDEEPPPGAPAARQGAVPERTP